MTTILADQDMGLMAADFMVTSNDGEVQVACNTKIEEIYIGGDLYLVGAAGLEGPSMYFLEWFEHGSWDEPPEPIYDVDLEDDFSILVLGPDGIFVADKFCRLSPVHHRWYAVGSGGTHAWSVLEAGCGVEKAMQAACKMDPYTGFGFEVKRLDGTQEIYVDERPDNFRAPV
jgi:ATP-dependent protease HslVU (ClpYQ) peptidase subunit